MNDANAASKQGDDRHFTEEFRDRPSWQCRLTDLGISQARSAGAWLRENGLDQFDRYYVSDYIRAIETALHLDLKGAEWRTSLLLRERDWGELDTKPHTARETIYAEVMADRARDAFFWYPPRGESLAKAAERIRSFFDTLHRECDGKKVIIVCHGEVMWLFRYLIEHMSPEQYRDLDRSTDPKNEIHNCQIIQYTRHDARTGGMTAHYKLMRSVWPVDLSQSRNRWEAIERRELTNDDLQKIVDRHPRLVND